MSQEEPDVKGLCRDVLKNGLLLAERTEELAGGYSGQKVEQTMVETMNEMLSNAEDPNRQQRIIMLSANLGQRLGSDTILSFAQEAQSEWENKYGGA